MKYINHREFNKVKRKKSTTIFTHKTLPPEEAKELIETASEKLYTSPSARTLDTITTTNKKRYIFKTSHLRHRNIKLRVTLGTKRFGAYDRFIAEIHNQLQLLDCSYIPRMAAYGYKKNKLGLVTHTAIITEYKENTLNIIEHIQSTPTPLPPLLNLSFNLILRHVLDGHIHLDLSPANIIVTKDLTRAYMVDVEQFKVFASTAKTTEEKIGFCFGFFYKSGLAKYTPLYDYIDICANWISSCKLDLDETVFFKCILQSIKFHSGKKVKLTSF